MDKFREPEQFDAEVEIHDGEPFAVWAPAVNGSHVKAEVYFSLLAELEAIRADASQVFKEIGNELGCNPDNESIMMAIDALNERLANRDAQPVAWASTASLKRGDVREVWPNGEQHKAGKLCITALYTAPPAPAVVKLPTEFHSDEGGYGAPGAGYGCAGLNWGEI